MAGRESLISVIVPIYNVEKCIEATLQSIKTQTHANIEVVMVDDGSTDASGEICDAWANRDSRFVALHKANGGLSSARNVGIESSHGEYITFVDGDDLLDPKALGILLDAIQRTSSDVAVGSLQKLREGTSSFKNNSTIAWDAMSSKDCIEKLLFCNGISMSACGKLYRSSMWRHHRFPEGSYYEDVATIPILLAACGRICVIETALYGYVTRRGSITGTGSMTEKKYLDAKSELGKLEYHLLNLTSVSQDAIEFFSAFTWLSLFRYLSKRNRFIDPREYTTMRRDLRKKTARWVRERRTTRVNRMRLLLFSISPTMYEAVFRLYAGISRMNVV